MGTERRNGLDLTRLHSTRWGERGPRVLLLHAIGLSHQSWEGIAPQLGQSAQVVAVDLPGHGESDKPADADYGLRSLGRRVIQFLDELGWDDCILVGNSLGGGTSLSVALQAPERVRGLALFSSVGFRWGLPLVGRLAFLPVAPAICRFAPPPVTQLGLSVARRPMTFASRDQSARVTQYMRDHRGSRAFFATLQQLYGGDLDEMAEQYGRLPQRVMVAHGRQDLLLPYRHSEALARALPVAQLVPIDRCGHFPQEEQPAEVLKLLRQFVSEIAA